MSDPNQAAVTPDHKVADQAELVTTGFRDVGIEVEVHYTPDHRLNFACQKNVLLVRDGYLDRVRDLLPEAAELDDASNGIINGVHLHRLPESLATIDALERIDRELGVGVATPNHVLSITRSVPYPGSVPDPGSMCPATEPEQVPPGVGPDPGVAPGDDGADISIFVADTGLLDDAHTHPWLAGVDGEQDPLSTTDDGDVLIPPYGGHGTFVAGVARCMAPGADVYVANVFDRAGARLESDVIAELDAALDERGPDIISLSAGGTSRLDLPYLGFQVFFQERLSQYKGIAFVAAAGNNAARRPFWPAAFPWTVSAGALAANWRRRAYFSDHAGWVDVYAPGEGLVNAFATGSYKCTERPHVDEWRTFEGMARWSGTSFSTPMVSGLIAARMSRTGENGRQAAEALLAAARAHAIPRVGAVLLPDTH
jgi:Subtilase family